MLPNYSVIILKTRFSVKPTSRSPRGRGTNVRGRIHFRQQILSLILWKSWIFRGMTFRSWDTVFSRNYMILSNNNWRNLLTEKVFELGRQPCASPSRYAPVLYLLGDFDWLKYSGALARQGGAGTFNKLGHSTWLSVKWEQKDEQLTAHFSFLIWGIFLIRLIVHCSIHFLIS